MDWLEPLLSTLSIIISVLLTIIAYQWKVGHEQTKTLQALSILVQEPGVLSRIYAHVLMEDPAATAKERFRLEQRMKRVEEIIELLATKRKNARTIQQLIDHKIDEIQ